MSTLDSSKYLPLSCNREVFFCRWQFYACGCLWTTLCSPWRFHCVAQHRASHRHKPCGGHNIYIHIYIVYKITYGMLSRQANCRIMPCILYLFVSIHPPGTLLPQPSQRQANCSDTSHILSLTDTSHIIFLIGRRTAAFHFPHVNPLPSGFQ
jgi:hypothetical protein